MGPGGMGPGMMSWDDEAKLGSDHDGRSDVRSYRSCQHQNDARSLVTLTNARVIEARQVGYITGKDF